MPVTRIMLDAAGWQDFRDIYAALLPALGAPDWHGPNLDAVYDALVAGHYRIRPPIVVTVQAVNQASQSMRTYLARLVTVFDDAQAQYGIDARLVLA